MKTAEKRADAAWEKLCDYCNVEDGEMIYDESLWKNDLTYKQLKKEFDYWSRVWSELNEQDEFGQMMLENGAY